jgi:hypothetical protein
MNAAYGAGFEKKNKQTNKSWGGLLKDKRAEPFLLTRESTPNHECRQRPAGNDAVFGTH